MAPGKFTKLIPFGLLRRLVALETSFYYSNNVEPVTFSYFLRWFVNYGTTCLLNQFELVNQNVVASYLC